MILFEITNNEDHPSYQELEIANGNRQYSFLLSMVKISLDINRPFLSETLIKALNYQAIACLHVNAGEYRPCPVGVGEYSPPAHYRVRALMDDFINHVNRTWETADPVLLTAFVLWRINHIHPFINGNGRTARAACYFVLCAKCGGLLPGETILPELLRRNRDEYVDALREADQSLQSGNLNLARLHALLTRLIDEQLRSGGIAVPTENGEGQQASPLHEFANDEAEEGLDQEPLTGTDPS